MERYHQEREVLLHKVLTPLYEQIRAQARCEAVLVDGLVVPIGEPDAMEALYSD